MTLKLRAVSGRSDTKLKRPQEGGQGTAGIKITSLHGGEGTKCPTSWIVIELWILPLSTSKHDMACTMLFSISMLKTVVESLQLLLFLKGSSVKPFCAKQV